MKKLLTSLLWATCLLTNLAYAQIKNTEEIGFRHLPWVYQKDTVHILVKSAKGDEQKPKPLFFFCQGSLPQPLIKYDEQGVYGVFPFATSELEKEYHLVMVGKPAIPLIADAKYLGKNFVYLDKNGVIPPAYTKQNLLSYYVPRNIAIIKYLQKQSWVSAQKLVVAGHSEGSTIASKLALAYPKVTHLIYSGGNPMGRILSIIAQSRAYETNTDSTKYGEQELAYWSKVVENPTMIEKTEGDSYKTTFEFSNPPIQYLEKLRIPVLVCYGTKDWSAPFNDFLRVEMIRNRKKNFQFNAYIGLEHNYFGLLPNGTPNYDDFNWDRVAQDWLRWLKTK